MRPSRAKSPILFLTLPILIALQVSAARAKDVTLPAFGPVPQFAPVPKMLRPSPSQLPVDQASIPVPQARPDPLVARLPVERPPKDEMFGPPAPQMLPDKRSNAERPAVMPQEEKACRARLKALGANFEEAPPQASAKGCALPYPIRLKRLSASIDLEPDAVINCATAETAVHFATGVIAPAAESAFGEELAMISQASAYVCRPRNGTRKLSEHAFGNALDISRFILTGGSTIDVEPAPPGNNAKFLAAVRKAACGPFKTVLGPGSDADHALHFHFDLAPRRNGSTFCK